MRAKNSMLKWLFSWEIHHETRIEMQTMIQSTGSWGDDLRSYKTSKASLPWREEQASPVVRVTRYEKSRQEREYDPILGHYRNTLRDNDMQSTINARIREKMENKERKMLHKTNYNVVNHQLIKKTGTDSTANRSQKMIMNTRIGYNIINNIDLPQSRRPAVIAVSKPQGRTKVDGPASNRPFNMISNKYLRDHSTKFENDANIARQRAEEKFWRTHDFNPLTAEFYDKEKEKDFISRRIELQKTHGSHATDKLPPSEQYSEGRLYNIIDKRIIDKQKFTKMDNIYNRGINSKNALEIEKRIRDEAEKMREVYGQRSLNRVAHTRFEEQARKGYDLITFQPHHGRNSKSLAESRTQRKILGWELLDSQRSARENAFIKNYRDLSGAESQTEPNALRSRPITRKPKKSNQVDVLVIEHSKDRASTSVGMRPSDNAINLHRGDTARPNTVLSNPRSTPGSGRIRTGGF